MAETEATGEDGRTIEKLKKVHFFGLAVSHSARVDRGEVEDWPTQLAAHLTAEARHRIITDKDGMRLVAQAAKRPDQVGIGRVVDDTGLTLANLSDETFTPVVAESADEFFTRVTYLQFLPDCNAIALVGGAAERPSKHVVEVFLNAICPLTDDANWVCRELYTAGQIDKLEGVPGIEKMTVVSDAMAADLTKLDFDKANNLGELSTALATLFGGEIRVRLDIKVKRPQQQGNATQLLRDWVRRSIPNIGQAEKMTVKTTGLGAEILELVQHKLSAYVPLPQGRVSGRQLEADVLASLASVCADWQNRVRKAVEAM